MFPGEFVLAFVDSLDGCLNTSDRFIPTFCARPFAQAGMRVLFASLRMKDDQAEFPSSFDLTIAAETASSTTA